MITIHKKNVYSQLSDYTSVLENELAVFHESYWFSPRYKAGLWDGKTHFLKVPSLKVPTGLLFIVEEHLKKYDIEFKIIDERKKPEAGINYQDEGTVRRQKDLLLKGIELRDYQITAIQKAIY